MMQLVRCLLLCSNLVMYFLLSLHRLCFELFTTTRYGGVEAMQAMLELKHMPVAGHVADSLRPDSLTDSCICPPKWEDSAIIIVHGP